MSRNSEINRAGMGGRVEELAGEGMFAPAIAATISQESGKDFSKSMIHRHLQKSSLNAAIPAEVAALEMLAAAITGQPDAREAGETAYYGLYKLNTSNAFTGYYGIARGLKNGQVMRGFKNIALKITSGARIVGDEKDAEKIEALTQELNFSTLLQDVVRSTCEMGTTVTEKSDKGEFITPQILPMRYITLLTDRETPGTTTDKLVHGMVTQVIINESDDANQHVYKRDEVGLFRIWGGGNEFIDIKGRHTDGIYGESMTLGLETPLKSLLNSSYYYDLFVKRYGMGRLHINMKLLADMLKDKEITTTAATKSRDDTTAALQKIGANEDIISMGEEIKMIESKQGFDIMPFISWREKQINRTLLQSDVGAGDVGSSWTSAGTAVSAQDYDTYNSLRDTFFEMFMEEIIVPRLEYHNLNPKSISITATPFLKVDVPYRDLIEMYDRGNVTEGEVRTRAGFSYEKPDEV